MSNKDLKSCVIMHGFFEEANFTLLAERKFFHIVVLEGRPNLISSQETCQGILKYGLIPTVITDNMAGFLFYKKLVREVWLTYRQVDHESAVCLVGSLILAVLGKKHGVEVRAYPTQNDSSYLGSAKDLARFWGVSVAPKNVKAYVPLWEAVPLKYINVLQPDIQCV